MKYYAYNELSDNYKFENIIVTRSENQIIEVYWPYWYGRMCEQFGKREVDKNYTIEDCIEDYVIVNWAWEVTP